MIQNIKKLFLKIIKQMKRTQSNLYEEKQTTTNNKKQTEQKIFMEKNGVFSNYNSNC